MNLIVAVDENWGIGKDGDLLCRISADMKMFRETTTGHTLVLGRKTLESFPNKKPLPNRTHIVLTTNQAYDAQDVILCHDMKQLFTLLKTYDSDDLFVIGGGSIYQQLLPYCKKAYVTKIYDTFAADTVFPNLDNIPEWKHTEIGQIQEENGVRFSFDIYTQSEENVKTF